VTTEDSEAVEQSQQVSLHFQKMDGWAVLRHQFKGGKFDGVVAVAVMGFLYVPGDPNPKGVVTVLGAETAAQPLMGPYGEVTNDGSVFPSVDEYCEWFEQRAQ
jgi:hypothetical protein